MPVRKAPTVTVRILPNEDPAFVDLIRDADDFPQAYEEWLKRHLQFDATRRARGEDLKEVIVCYADFVAYCEAVRLRPSKYALLACMIALNGGWKRI